MNKHLYKFNFKIKCYCSGLYSFADAHLSIVAESEEEARRFFKENVELSIEKIDVTLVK